MQNAMPKLKSVVACALIMVRHDTDWMVESFDSAPGLAKSMPVAMAILLPSTT